MKKLKLIPFYLLLTLNAFIIFIYLIGYPESITSDQMPWNAESLGWKYENKINYTIVILLDLFFVIAPSVYALKNRKINIKRAYIAILIPFFIHLSRYIYYRYFFNI